MTSTNDTARPSVTRGLARTQTKIMRVRTHVPRFGKGTRVFSLTKFAQVSKPFGYSVARMARRCSVSAVSVAAGLRCWQSTAAQELLNAPARNKNEFSDDKRNTLPTHYLPCKNNKLSLPWSSAGNVDVGNRCQ